MVKRDELLETLGHIKGTMEAMDKRVERMGKKQDEVLKTISKHAVMYSGVMAVGTSLVVAAVKAGMESLKG